MPKGNGNGPPFIPPGQSGNQGPPFTPPGHGGTPGSPPFVPPGQNEAPTDILIDNAAFDENVDGAVVGTLTVVDPNAQDTHEFAVDDARFEVVDGVLRVKAGTVFDYETDQSVTLNVTATDFNGASVVKQIVVNVNDVNEAPDAGADFATNADEDVDDTVVLATVNAGDPDILADTSGNGSFDDLSYAIIAGDPTGLFEIDANGNISLATGMTLDFETSTQHVLTVEVSDGGGLTDLVEVTIDVNDVPEGTNDTVIGPLFQMNQTTGNNQFLVHVTTLATGNAAAAWNDGPSNVSVGIFDPTGQSLFQHTIPTGGAQPDIASFSDGSFVVSWATSGSVFLQRFDANGVLLDPVPQLVNTGTNGNPDVAVLPDDSFVIVYQDDGGGGDNVNGRYYSSAGVPGAEFTVAGAGGAQGDPAIALLSNGNLAVTYDNHPNAGGDGSGFGTFLVIIQPDGTPVTGSIQVNTSSAGNQLTTEVIALSGGKFLVSWEDDGVASPRDIMGQVFNNDGTQDGSAFTLNPTTNGSQAGHDIVALDDGGFLVAYSSATLPDGSAASSRAVLAQRYDSAGQAIGDELVIADGLSQDSFIEMTLLQNGSVFLSYNGPSPGGTDPDIATMGRIITFDSSTGSDGDDTLISGPGDSVLFGGDGDDLFILGDGSGTTTVTDFEAGSGSDDVLDISDFSFADFAAVMLQASDIPLTNDMIINLDADDALILEGVQTGDLHPDDFLI